ncbi:MAG: glycosyltransferase family 2 protein [Deltaproteobacteria bacterium]|nr:glycosyltransferase family 2 protein [Deltaproteobacteria bacterium]
MAKDKPSISIIVPCYNEEGNLRGTIEAINGALASAKRFSGHEILIYNDRSTDSTGALADAIAKKDRNVKVIHNAKNMGFGFNYTDGVRRATKDYVMMVPGDNEIPLEAIMRVMARAGDADVIIPYTANPEVRPFSRRVISRAFVALINTMFGLDIIYYNGTCLVKSRLLKKVPLKTWGFAYMAAILVRLLKSGASYAEVGVDIAQRSSGKTKAFAFKNVVSVVKAILTLFWDVRVKERAIYAGKPSRAEATKAR